MDAKRIFLIFIIVFLLGVFSEFVRIYGSIVFSESLVNITEPFSHDPGSSNVSERILFVGDSTGVGIGAIDPRDSIAGRLSSDFPNAEIVNLSVSGYVTSDARGAIRNADGHFVLTIIQSGGNDIIKLISPEHVVSEMRALIHEAQSISDHVLVLTVGNIGFVPFVPPYLKWFYADRSKIILSKLELLAKKEGVLFVDFYEEYPEDDLFLRDVNLFYSPDYFHPSARGYDIAYERVRDVLIDEGILVLPAQ